jgi:hypothetical protein
MFQDFTHADPTKTITIEQYKKMITSQPMDNLDNLSLNFIRNLKHNQKQVIEFGGNLGVHSKRMSINDASVTMIDQIKLPENHFTQFGHDGLIFLNITHLQKDFKDINERDLPETIDLIYSQRALNYLDYQTTKQILSMLFQRLADHGAIFISMAGYDTEYGVTHKSRNNPIESRFDFLGDDMQDKHNIRHKICIYTRAELETLLTEIGFHRVSSFQSGFGNVKAIGYKSASNPIETLAF